MKILRKTRTFPLAVKLAAAASAVLLFGFAVMFFSGPGGERSAAPAAEGAAAVFSPAAYLQTPGQAEADRVAFIENYWRWIFIEAGIPDRISGNLVASMVESSAFTSTFMMELLAVLQQDYYTFLLVDKEHSLPLDYSPGDLVPLTAGGSFRITRDDLSLRRSAAAALEEMSAAAAAEGITLTAASTYRSAARQAEIFRWQVNTFGLETAERQSARPGHSQHQLGTAVDFFPIHDDFGDTAASRWLTGNASRFGWSLSYPDGYEHITGYRFEPWHYRYVGGDLALFIDRYFEGIQQFALQFIQVWQEHNQQ